MTRPIRLIRPITVLCASLLLAGCAGSRTPIADEAVSTVSAGMLRAEHCADNLAGTALPDSPLLDANDLSLVNWNIRKGGHPQWPHDLARIATAPDLVLFQEAVAHSGASNPVTADWHASFAPGYRTARAQTGVMTASAVRPLRQCRLVTHEPWLRSAKATMVSEYGLSGTRETLLVVNVHSVNFTFGLRHFTDQIEQMTAIIERHAGPVVLSGDFNTWRGGRVAVVEEYAERLGLQRLQFDIDHRKRFFGLPLDHIYVRGFEVMQATTREVNSSDHNPMAARLRLETTRGAICTNPC